MTSQGKHGSSPQTAEARKRGGLLATLSPRFRVSAVREQP
jgi:hypothetical protein